MFFYHFALIIIASVSCVPFEGEIMDGSVKLKNLRSLMTKNNICGYIATSTDPHMSEYLLDADKDREYITGFTGSYGIAVVTDSKAALWTDSRYFIQAKKQISNEWTIVKQGEDGAQSIKEWLSSNVKSGCRVGVDGKKIDSDEYEEISKHLGKSGIKLVSVPSNLVDEIWEDKPSYPDDPVFVHDIKYAGQTWTDKVAQVQNLLNGNCLVVSALDEIAWLLNLRGSDFKYSPLFRSFLILNGDCIDLYIPLNKVTQRIRNHLNSAKIKVNINEYEQFWSDLPTLGQTSKNITLPKLKRGGTSFQIKNLLPSEKVKSEISPILELKSYKNSAEVEGMRKAHILDAVALCQLMMDLTNDIENGNNEYWDEMKVVSELEKLRGEQEFNMGSSFATISAFGPNSALPHYAVTNETNRKIDNTSCLTIDSGGQYKNGGTIDTTRVIRVGTPTDIEILVYTAILRGVINLACTIFPEGIKIDQLQFIARRPLYQIGRDFGHGITHGTGSFLNVHEGHNGTYRVNFIGSQEPGYYKENEFGMRLENLVVVVEAQVESHSDKKLCGFLSLTKVPYERKLIDLSAMDKSELNWLNNYHMEVRKEVGEEMLKQNKTQLYEWLVKQTEPLHPTS